MPFKKILIYKTENTLLLMFRYALVTWISFVIDTAILFFLTDFLLFHYLVSATISSLSGGLANYYLSISPQVFGKSKFKNKWVEFILFTSVGAGGLIINLCTMWIFTDICGWYYMTSKIIAIATVFSWNFFIRKKILFYNKQENDNNNYD